MSSFYIYCLLALFLLIPLVALIRLWRSRLSNREKIIWTLLIIFTNPLGSLVFFLLIPGEKLRQP